MNIAWTFLAMAATLFTGWMILCMLWPDGRNRGDCSALAVRLCLALGVGQAVAAVNYLLWRVACSHAGILYKLADCLLIPLLAWLAARSAQPSARGGRSASAETAPPVFPLAEANGATPPSTSSTRRWSIGLLLLVSALIVSAALCICLARDCYEPLGAWDGWAIWNLKARFLFRSGSDWTAMFSRHIWFSHPDYPLLIPASVARLWTYLQTESTLAPQLVSIAFTSLVTALLFASLAWLRGLIPACLAVILLVSYEPFLQYGGAQMSDIPLSFYFLATIVVLAMSGRFEPIRIRLMVLAGVIVGCALIVKNEGQPLTLSLLVAMAVVAWYVAPPSGGPMNRLKAALRTRSVLFLLAGAIPCLLVLVAQKMFFAGSSYLVADQPSTHAVFQKMFDPGRHQTILQFLLTYDLGLHFWHPFTGLPISVPVPNQPALLLLIALPLVSGLRNASSDRRSSMTSAIAIGLTLLIYYTVFLVMPYDLQNLLESFPRLQLHFWPALIFTVLLATRLPGDPEQQRTP